MGINLLKLDDKLAQAFTNLRGNRDFEAVLAGLLKFESEELQRCIDLEGVTLHRSQGAVKTLQLIQKMYLEAPTTLEKLKNQALSTKSK